MDKEFNTTFIPKQTMVPREAQTTQRGTKKRPMGFLGLITVFVVIITVALFAAVFLMESRALASITRIEEQIATIRADFDEEFLEELKSLDSQLKVADQRLSGHIGFSRFLYSLEDDTLPTVRFNSLGFLSGTELSEVDISGEASSYKSIAQQSRILNDNNYIREHIFSGLQRDTETGRVSFGLRIELDPNALLFANQLAL